MLKSLFVRILYLSLGSVIGFVFLTHKVDTKLKSLENEFKIGLMWSYVKGCVDNVKTKKGSYELCINKARTHQQEILEILEQ